MQAKNEALVVASRWARSTGVITAEDIRQGGDHITAARQRMHWTGCEHLEPVFCKKKKAGTGA